MQKKISKARRDTRLPRLKDLLAAEQALLRTRLAAARAALGSHAGELGASLEHEARAFLRTFLPNEYGLGRGFVIWREPCDPGRTTEPTWQFADDHYRVRVSTQLDIIVYDAVRGGAIADLGTAQVYPFEHVYGYVEVKAVFLDELEHSLRVSKYLRSNNLGFYCGRPMAFRELIGGPMSDIAALELRDDDPNAAIAVPLQRPRLSCWFIAFEYARRRKSRRRPAAVQRTFEAHWKRVGHWARFEGVLLVELTTPSTSGAAFLRSIPDAKNKRPFNSELVLEGAIGRFKTQMLTDLVMTDRMRSDIAVLYDGYWST